MNKKIIIKTIIFSLILGLSVIGRYAVLAKGPFLNGPDAYYYALQIKFFAMTGFLKIHDSSPLLQLMGWTGKMGLSCEQTLVLWTVLIQFFCVISVLIAYRFIRKDNSSSVIPSLVFAWIIFSPTLTYTCIEFPKYAFSLIFLPLWPVGLVNKRLWPVSLGAVIISCVSHLTMIGLLFLVLLGVPMFEITRLNFKIFKKPQILIGVAFVIIIMGIILSKFLLLADLKRIQFQGLQLCIWTFFSRRELPMILKIEVAVSILISIILLVTAFKDRTKIVSRFWVPFTVFILLTPLGSQEVMGIPERLSLILPFVTICSLIGSAPKKLEIAKKLYLLIYSFLLLVVIFPNIYLDMVHPNRLNPDYQSYNQVTLAIERLDIPMLITHQGLNYYYKYQTMKESFPYEPESHWPKHKIWRIVYGVKPSELSYYLPENYLWDSGFLFSLPGQYSLIREDCWNLFRNQVKLSSNEELKGLVLDSWLNPSQKRPEFVRKRAGEDSIGEFSAYPNSR